VRASQASGFGISLALTIGVGLLLAVCIALLERKIKGLTK
jgi:hypothetical protein